MKTFVSGEFCNYKFCCVHCATSTLRHLHPVPPCATRSGPLLASLAAGIGGEVVARACCPDEQAAIRRHLVSWSDGEPAADLILTTGGTGFAERDVTPEVSGSHVMPPPRPRWLCWSGRRRGWWRPC